MKVLVTGANGYIGRHVVNSLLQKGVEVIACDFDCSDLDERAQCITLDLFTLPQGNIWEHLGSPDICLHMAWRNGFIHNAPTHLGDLSAHYKFLTAMIDGGLKHLAVMGSMHEIGYWEGVISENTPCNPTSMYGIAKDALRRAMVQYANVNNCVLQWLRCFYILGDDKKSNSIFCKLLNAAEEGNRSFPFTTGKNKYDFISVDVLAKLIAETLLQDKINGIINCCSGTPISLAQRVEQFISDNNLNIKLDYGAYPDRSYDSPCVYGDTYKINKIVGKI